MEKIGIACDHAGYEMKEFLVGYLSSKGFDVVDFGTHSEESIDYPDFGHALASAIEAGEMERGVGLCGSGEGMAMTLNKHQGIRAGLCWNDTVAELIRQHNNANVVVLPAQQRQRSGSARTFHLQRRGYGHRREVPRNPL